MPASATKHSVQNANKLASDPSERCDRTGQALCGFRALRSVVAVFLLCLATAIASHGQKLIDFYNFHGGANGQYPTGPLFQGFDGNFYGTTSVGGTFGGGTIFKLSVSPKALTTLYSFCIQTNCTDGILPMGGVIQGTDGNFYGTTAAGGVSNAICRGNNCGTVFKITPTGTLTTLYNFCSQANCSDGWNPQAGLVQASDGNFYGTTVYGGVINNYCFQGCGTVFKITPTGTLTTLYRFCAQGAPCADGSFPFAALIQATDGKLYGTTLQNSIFNITLQGVLTTLSQNGSAGSLVQGTDGSFYGTTFQDPYGRVFKITPQGAFTALYTFCAQPNCADGYNPLAGMVQANDGNFYGTTSNGGGHGAGTIFKITATGTFTTLASFDGGGQQNANWMFQATRGTFYPTNQGGIASYGKIDQLSVGLGPFVETLPTSGRVGTGIKILGTNLTGATGVSFNGVAALFKVVSSSEITATVPPGASTGPVTVTTPSGTLSSNTNFLVRPQITSFTPTNGPVGTSVGLTGISLTQTTQVAFGGITATFTVNSDTQVTATVPTGAKTSRITITTPGGIAYSPTSFTVTP